MSILSGILSGGDWSLAEIQQAFDLRDDQLLIQAVMFDSSIKLKDYEGWFIYYSLLRPFTAFDAVLRALGISPSDAHIENVTSRKGKQFGVLFSRKPLPLYKVEQFELRLDARYAYLPMLREYAEGKKMLAFREDDTGFLLFKNPRGVWQLSRFKPEVGPVGHIEAGTQAELLKETIHRMRPDDGEYVRAIMDTL